MRHGNLDFLNKHKDYITGLVRQISEHIDADGNEEMNPGKKGNMTRFLDWPSTPNRKGVEAGYRALMSWALASAEELCGYLKEDDIAKMAQDARLRLDSHPHDPNGSLQAAALMLKAGTISPDDATAMILSKGAYGLTTFYGYYMLEALAATGDHQEALDIIRSYWGAMLDLGATSFWEDFNMEWLNNAARIDEMTPDGKIDIHGAYGDYCYNGYRHSLCHGWSSGPCPWLSRHILGINIVEPGCRKVSVKPNLCDLQFAEGTFPTPYGTIYVSHRRADDGSVISDIKLPEGVELGD